MKKIKYAFALVLLLCHPVMATEVSIGLASNFSKVVTGSFNPYGGYFKNGATLALEDAKARLNKKNIQIKFVEFDYGASDVKVLEIAKAAVKSSVVAVLGYNYSSSALLAGPIHHDGHLPMLSPSATATRLATMGRYVHMGSFDNTFMGTSLAHIARERLKATTAVIIPAVDCAYCADLAKNFETAFEAENGKVILSVPVLLDSTDFSKVVEKLEGLKTDVIFIPNQELNSARIIAVLTNAGFKQPFLGADGWGNVGDEFFGILNGLNFTGYSVSHWHPELDSTMSREFIKKYTKAFNKEPNDNSVLAYDSMSLLIEAILLAKKYDREGIENALAGIRRFNGVTGEFDMAPGRAPRKSLVLLQASGKKFKPLGMIAPKRGAK